MQILGNILDICKVNKFLFFSLSLFHVSCCTEILAFLATQNSCVNKVHVMLCYTNNSFNIETFNNYPTRAHWISNDR